MKQLRAAVSAGWMSASEAVSELERAEIIAAAETDIERETLERSLATLPKLPPPKPRNPLPPDYELR